MRTLFEIFQKFWEPSNPFANTFKTNISIWDSIHPREEFTQKAKAIKKE